MLSSQVSPLNAEDLDLTLSLADIPKAFAGAHLSYQRFRSKCCESTYRLIYIYKQGWIGASCQECGRIDRRYSLRGGEFGPGVSSSDTLDEMIESVFADHGKKPKKSSFIRLGSACCDAAFIIGYELGSAKLNALCSFCEKETIKYALEKKRS